MLVLFFRFPSPDWAKLGLNSEFEFLGDGWGNAPYSQEELYAGRVYGKYGLKCLADYIATIAELQFAPNNLEIVNQNPALKKPCFEFADLYEREVKKAIDSAECGLSKEEKIEKEKQKWEAINNALDRELESFFNRKMGIKRETEKARIFPDKCIIPKNPANEGRNAGGLLKQPDFRISHSA